MGGIKSEKENLNTCKHISGVSSYTSICKLLGVDAFIYRIYTNIEKQEVWISFYASLIGSGITLLGVALTICYTDFTRKEDFRKHEHFLEFAKVIRQPGFIGEL